MSSAPDKFDIDLEAVRAEYDAEVFLYSGAVDNRNYGILVREVAKPSTRPNALLILTTNGGQANAAYKIARLMQRSFTRFTLFAPRLCYSAGTLIALGAHCLIMDKFSELGPLDVQLDKKNELADTKSGLLSKSTFDSLSEAGFDIFQGYMLNIIGQSGGLISFDVASRVAATMTSSMMAPIFAQVNPDVVGSDYRDLNVAIQYGERLIATSGNAERTAVSKLVKSYPAHDFIIDDQEARGLFRTVDAPSEKLYKLVPPLARLLYSQATPGVVRKLEPAAPQGPNAQPNPTGSGKPSKSKAAKGSRPARK